MIADSNEMTVVTLNRPMESARCAGKIRPGTEPALHICLVEIINRREFIDDDLLHNHNSINRCCVGKSVSGCHSREVIERGEETPPMKPEREPYG